MAESGIGWNSIFVCSNNGLDLPAGRGLCIVDQTSTRFGACGSAGTAGSDDLDGIGDAAGAPVTGAG